MQVSPVRFWGVAPSSSPDVEVDLKRAPQRSAGHSSRPAPDRAPGGTGPPGPPGWIWLAGVFALALGLRLLYLEQVRHSPIVEALLNDSDFYHRWAATLAGGEPFGGRIVLQGQPFFMSPGYPTALGALYRIAGIDVLLALRLHAVLGALVPVLVMLWSARAFGVTAGRIAGMLVALYPPLIVYDVALLTAMPINLLNMAALVLIQAAGPVGVALVPALAAGACVGASALCRPNVLLWGATLAGWMLVSGGRALGLRRAALFALAIAAMLAPVALRNLRETGTPSITVASFGMNLWTGNHAGASGKYQGAEFVSTQEPVEEDAGFRREAGRRLGRAVTSDEASRYWAGEAWRWITSDPIGWARLLLRKASLFWHDTELPGNLAFDFARGFSPLVRAIPAGFALLGALAVAGLWLTAMARAPARRSGGGAWRDLAPALLLVACYTFTNILFFTLAEYRLAVVPVFAGFAGAAVARVWRAIRGTASWQGVPVAAGLAVVALLVALRPDPGNDRTAAAVRNYLNAGTVYARMERNDRAVAMCEAALRIRPDEVRAHLMLNLIEDRRGNVEVALRHLGEAERLLTARLAHAPNDAWARTDLAIVYEKQGRTGEAEAEYRRALAIEPGNARARGGLERLLGAQR